MICPECEDEYDEDGCCSCDVNEYEESEWDSGEWELGLDEEEENVEDQEC
jgi:hypothetical protein